MFFFGHHGGFNMLVITRWKFRIGPEPCLWERFRKRTLGLINMCEPAGRLLTTYCSEHLAPGLFNFFEKLKAPCHESPKQTTLLRSHAPNPSLQVWDEFKEGSNECVSLRSAVGSADPDPEYRFFEGDCEDLQAAGPIYLLRMDHHFLVLPGCLGEGVSEWAGCHCFVFWGFGWRPNMLSKMIILHNTTAFWCRRDGHWRRWKGQALRRRLLIWFVSSREFKVSSLNGNHGPFDFNLSGLDGDRSSSSGGEHWRDTPAHCVAASFLWFQGWK